MNFFISRISILLICSLLISCHRNDCDRPCYEIFEPECILEFQFQQCCPCPCICPELVQEKLPPAPFREEFNEDDFEENQFIDTRELPHRKYEPSVPEYRASIGDILEISVFDDNENISADVTIAPDGKLYYLFLEGIEVRGLALSEIKKKVSDKLANLFINPTVSIIPRLMMRDNFTILGSVSYPGIYSLKQQVTVRQAIGLAGGLATDQMVYNSYRGDIGTHQRFIGQQGLGQQTMSNLRDSFLIRDGKRQPIDFEKLVYSGDPTDDIPIHAGDYLYIAKNQKKDIYVMGEQMRGQAIPYTDGMTLLGAIAAAGNWNDVGPYGSDFSRVIVLRGALCCPQALVADLYAMLGGSARDVYLEPGDIIYVHQKSYRFLRELVDLTVNTFIASFANIAGSYDGNRAFNKGDH